MSTNEHANGPDDSTERVLIHVGYPLWRKHMLVTIARAKELQDEGKQVTLTHCNAARGTCAINYAGNPIACQVCRSRVKSMASAAGLPLISLDVSDQCEDDRSSVTECDRNDLAEGVQSGITSTFRALPNDADSLRFIRRVKRRYLRNAERLFVAFQKAMTEIRPDRVEVFNGRQACARFALTAARKAGVPFNTLEITGTKRPIVFRGHTPHDRKQIQHRIKQNPADMEFAEAFYQRRRQPRNNRYAKRYSGEFTPPASDRFQKRVTVFLSSQDEFEALGKDWVSPFEDYAAAVRELCDTHPQFLFCIRFHPNQADITSDIFTPFADIAERDNVQAYYPKDPANTYRLIQWSDVVITFGSTVTVEACWMGKPVILLGPSFFDALDVSYTPATLAETHVLMRQELAPKDRTNAARFASYALTDGDSLKYIQEGNPFTATDFPLAHPVLGWIARVSDNMFCNTVKACMGISTARGQRQKAA